MKKRYFVLLGMLAVFFGTLAIMCVWAEAPAKEVRDSVLRFHIVANSDSDTDQANKYMVRDGIASLCAELFENSESKAESMEIAGQNKDAIALKAMQILAERECNDSVQVSIQKRFFPTRHYDGVSLPAGVYDTIDVRIGNAEGQNFWCVMFPEICLGTSARQNAQKMSDVLSEDGAELVTQDTPKIQFKFRIIEIIEVFKNWW